MRMSEVEVAVSELLGGAMTRDLSGGNGARDGKVDDHNALAKEVVAGFDADGALSQRSPLKAQLEATLNLIPAHTWYALPSGALTFVNERLADYLGISKDHPLRFSTATGAGWDCHIPLKSR